MKYERDCYVPVVTKNRDYLTGFLDALFVISPVIQLDFSLLDSMRLTDYLPNGQRRVDLDEEEIRTILKEYWDSLSIKENGIEKEVVSEIEDLSDEDVDEYKYLELNCVCGNYQSFNSPKDIPENSIDCDICGRRLLDYTDIEEEEFEYRGDITKVHIGTLSDLDDDSEFDDFEDEE